MSTILTIGHGGWSIPSFFEALKRYGVQVLVDVRSHPRSQYQPSFDHIPLRGACCANGVEYRYAGSQLGGKPEDPALYTQGSVDYGKIRQSENFRATFADLLAQDKTLCLMCSEGKPNDCHRTLLLGKAMADAGVDVRHILNDGSSATQESVFPKIYSKQGELF